MNREEKIKDLLESHNSTSLHISRLPPQVKKEFKEFSNKEFCNDFGFAFKHIWDFYKGIMNSEIQELTMRIEELENEMALQRETPKNVQVEEQESKPIKGLRGNIIKE